MLGREAYHRPMLLAEVEASDTPYSTSMAALVIARVLGRMADYAELEIASGERLSSITRHMLGLLSHRAGAREFRRLLSEGARLPHAGPELIRQAARLAAHGLEPTAAGPIAAERSHSGDRISGVY